MKKFHFTGILLFIMVIILAGCIRIPLGDEVILEISEAGIAYIKANDDDEKEEVEENRNDENEGEKEEEEDTSPVVLPVQKEEKEEEEEEKGGPIFFPTEDEDVYEFVEEPQCDDDHTEFTQHIDVDIYIPSCAMLVDVLHLSNDVQGLFIVDFVDYDTVLNNYRAFFGYSLNEDFNTDIADDPSLQRSVFLSGELANGKKLYASITQEEFHSLLILDYR